MASGLLVSAIVVNWNGARDLEACLPSLLDQSYRRMEIIIVDNGSTDDSASVVERFGVRWLPLERNLGLAPALNRGARAAAGDLLLFLNNDMRFEREFVTSLVSEMVERDDVLAADAIQYDWNGDHQVHLATSLRRRAEGAISHELTPGLHMVQQPCDEPAPAFMASAANLLARRSLFEALGGFDERLFFGYEDVDLCWRGWLRGWSTVFVPAAKCWHRVSHSTQGGMAGSLSFRGVETGRLVIAAKLLPFSYAIRTWLRSLAGLGRDLMLLRWQRVSDRARVLRQCLRDLPSLLRERWQIHRAAHTSPGAQLARLLLLNSAHERAACGPAATRVTGTGRVASPITK